MGDTALVLGGGGPLGGAWLTGVLAGLADAGVDLDRADVVIGTSAGAIFGARLACGESPQEMYERQLSGADRLVMRVSAGQTLRFLWAALGSRDPERSVQRLGRAALATRPSPGPGLTELLRPLLRGALEWPDRAALRITSVDAHTGQVETFGAESELTLVEAVAASCAVPVVWPPVELAGRRWMDGGSRSTSNIQLARDHERVLALSPIRAAVGPHPSAQQQVAELAAAGVAVTLLVPDPDSRRAMGRDMTADARRPDAARAGYAQAKSLADTVADVWHS
ncbi:patatin-like phospholipase family protein [Streptomyces fulvoviolaceus]|uniref:patatin-like phospholipase family protein n=1 Tax=Streptomyces fulvoviolaceus TaxID=285535 RepID=UPI0004C5A3C5|nr:patatin-like phospholipase family protein [Streptomyces fulvoviolaceus]